MKHPSLMNDILFKIVFGTPQNEPILRALLNAILGLTGLERIVELQLLNPHIDKEYLLERGAILDVKAKDGQNRRYNIEVQVSDQPAYIKRSLYYLARLFGEQLEKGESYQKIARTIGISILDFSLFPEFEDLHSTFRFYDAVHQRELSDILEIHYLELVKFKGEKPHMLRTPLEKWLHILKFGEIYQAGLETLPDLLQQEEGIDMAINSMNQALSIDEVREMIEFRKKALHDEATRMEHAHQQGLERGLERGLEQGREALRASAGRMLADGMEPKKVSQLLGLDLEQVLDLKK